MAFFLDKLEAAYQHGLKAVDVDKKATQAKAVFRTAKQVMSEVGSFQPKSEVCNSEIFLMSAVSSCLRPFAAVMQQTCVQPQSLCRMA